MSDRSKADKIYEALVARTGEGNPRPRLQPTRRAVELLGDPHRCAPVIHITGTNGKTTTSRMIENLLTAMGLRTGLLTSPHLLRFNERIRIDGVSISDESLVRVWEDIAGIIGFVDIELSEQGEGQLTFFEVLTVLAFAAFADAPVDVMVLEVGMGGEWDSTNVADGQVAVFTPVDLDHEVRLGATVEAIAHTKSGIIKPLADVVSAGQRPEVEAILRNAADATESTFVAESMNLISGTNLLGSFGVVSSKPTKHGQTATIRGLNGEYRDLNIPLHGRHHAQNAAVAIAAVESFIGGATQQLDEDIVREAMGSVASPGRLQQLANSPAVIVDAAHNPHGVDSLVCAIDEAFDFDDIAVVFGALGDKDVSGMVSRLAKRSARFFVVPPNSDRAMPAEELMNAVRAAAGELKVEGPFELANALESARSWAAGGSSRAVVVAGSILLVADTIALSVRDGWAKK